MTELTATRITREADKHFCKILSDAKAAADQSFLANLRQWNIEDIGAAKSALLSDEDLAKMYGRHVSMFQARKNKHGRELEEAVRTILAHYNIPFKEQVIVCKTTGEILGKKGKKGKNQPTHRVDFVVGHGIVPGRNISEFIVISTKTTCRDRADQDEWMKTAKPRLFVLLTSGSDYPSKVQFGNSDSRMIVSTAPAVRDLEIYKAIRVSKMLREIVQLLDDERRVHLEDNRLPAMALMPLQRQNAIHPHPFTQAPAPILSRPAPIPVPRTAPAATATTATTATTAATARGMILPKPVALAKGSVDSALANVCSDLTSAAAANATRHDKLYFWEENEYDDRLPSLPTV